MPYLFMVQDQNQKNLMHPWVDLLLSKLKSRENPLLEKQSDNAVSSKIPEWIKSNAGWWANGEIDDTTFVQAIQYLIKEDILNIPPTTARSWL